MTEKTNDKLTMSETEVAALRERLVESLKTIFDPEIPVNIWELGLVYQLVVDPSGDVLVVMTLTSPNCPAVGILPAQVEGYCNATEGVKKTTVELTWDPPWTPDRMSDAAKLELGLY